MKKIVLAALATVAGFTATPSMAQTAAGTVDITGTVAARCSAVTPISGSIALGELAKATGLVDGAFSGATNGLSRSFTVRCNGANPQISVNAKALVNAAATNSPNGYTNTVNYTATLAAAGAKGGTTSVADLSVSAGATTGLIGDRLSAAANNITLTIGSGTTTDANAILEAGSYQGNVDIIVAPAA